MADIPAILELLVGLTSAATYIFAFSFTSWLCYSQMYFVFNNRTARKMQVDPDLINFAETTSEPTLKMFRVKLNIWGEDWHKAGGAFKFMSILYGVANTLFFVMIPILHFALISIALRQIMILSGFDVAHIIFYAWVVVAHTLAVATWIMPSVAFTFMMSAADLEQAVEPPKGPEKVTA